MADCRKGLRPGNGKYLPTWVMFRTSGSPGRRTPPATSPVFTQLQVRLFLVEQAYQSMSLPLTGGTLFNMFISPWKYFTTDELVNLS